jgi:phage portal protein BeeE
VSPTLGSQIGSTDFIVGYRLMAGPRAVGFLSRDDVVHFRFGLDPEDSRLGISPLKCLMREIEADMAAADFTDTVLGNLGMPGLVIAPKDATWTPTPDQMKEMKAYIDGQSFRGDNQGKTLVLGKPTEILQLGGSDPNKVMLPSLRDIAEERVCAVIGIPAAVVGFGSGLQSTKVGATMRELVKMAWVTCINPTATTMAKQVTLQLLPDFVSQARRFRARFDNSDASYIQDEYDVRARTNALLVQAGILRVDRAQHELGLEVDTTRAIYLGPGSASGRVGCRTNSAIIRAVRCAPAH